MGTKRFAEPYKYKLEPLFFFSLVPNSNSTSGWPTGHQTNIVLLCKPFFFLCVSVCFIVFSDFAPPALPQLPAIFFFFFVVLFIVFAKVCLRPRFGRCVFPLCITADHRLSYRCRIRLYGRCQMARERTVQSSPKIEMILLFGNDIYFILFLFFIFSIRLFLIKLRAFCRSGYLTSGMRDAKCKQSNVPIKDYYFGIVWLKYQRLCQVRHMRKLIYIKYFWAASLIFFTSFKLK